MTDFKLERLPIHVDVEYPKAAHIFISRYNGMFDLIDMDNPEVLTTLLFMQEAVHSSRIEGTIATISDMLDFNVGDELNETLNLDIQEIENYQEALDYAMKEMADHHHDITVSMIKNIQHMLLDNVRGEEKLRGAFKTTQNYIGNKYDGEITYTPVSPILTNDYIENLVDYMNSSDLTGLDPIVKVAIIHAQFELIHPFEDGNGRVGRILIPVLLRKYKVIDTPFFYPSYYLSKHRDDYISRLEAISKHNDWEGWVIFFITAITEQSKMSMSMLRELEAIKQETKQKVSELKTTFSIQIVDFLFKKIKFDTSYFIRKTGINDNTARKLLNDLVDEGIISIEKTGSGKRATIYKFNALYEMIKRIES